MCIIPLQLQARRIRQAVFQLFTFEVSTHNVHVELLSIHDKMCADGETVHRVECTPPSAKEVYRDIFSVLFSLTRWNEPVRALTVCCVWTLGRTWLGRRAPCIRPQGTCRESFRDSWYVHIYVFGVKMGVVVNGSN
jgi:hypothetical protein